MRRLVLAVLCLQLLAAPRPDPAKYVALTFDDGPSGRFTRRLLDGLEKRDVKATFLLCGYRIQLYPEETERILRDGHEVGCHGFNHEKMSGMSRRDIGAEIADTLALLPQNAKVFFLRPPGGCCSDAVRQVASAKQLAILSWSVDPRDWATSDAASVEKNVLDHVEDGDVILLHDMSDSSVNAALDIVDKLHEQGFRFATVSQLAAMRGYRLQPGKVYARFPRKKPEAEQQGYPSLSSGAHAVWQ